MELSFLHLNSAINHLYFVLKGGAGCIFTFMLRISVTSGKESARREGLPGVQE